MSEYGEQHSGKNRGRESLEGGRMTLRELFTHLPVSLRSASCEELGPWPTREGAHIWPL